MTRVGHANTHVLLIDDSFFERNLLINIFCQQGEYMNQHIEDMSASDLIHTNMSEYGRYIVGSKLTHCIDGLKLSQRRILYTLKDVNDEIKELKFIGMVAEYHPHGDGNIASTIKRMMQDTEFGQVLVSAEGNSGGYGTESGGAARYMDVSIGPFAKDVFFDSTVHMRTIPMTPSEDYSTLEPMYLIPRIPTALLFPQLTVGYGFKSVTYPLLLENVCDLVKRYSEYRNSNPLHSFSTYGLEHCFLPEFPIAGYLRNEKELLEKFKKKEFNVTAVVEGMLDVYYDRYVLRSIPYGNKISNVTERDGKVEKALKDKNHWMSSAVSKFTDRKSNKSIAEYAVYLKRTFSTIEYLREFKKLVGLSSTFTPIHNFVTPEGKVREFTPVELLETWYRERYNSLLGGVKYRQVETIEQITLQKALAHVVDNFDDVTAIFKNNKTEEAVVKALVERFQLSKSQALTIVNGKMGNMTQSTRESIETRIAQLTKQAELYTEKLEKVHEHIYNDAVYLSKKYSKPRRTKIDPFIGYINLPSNNKGILQFESMEELVVLLNSFHDTKNMSISTYMGPETIKRLVIDGTMDRSPLSPSKQTIGDGILEYHPEMSVTIKIADGSVSAVNAICAINDIDSSDVKSSLFYGTPNFLTLSLYGHFKKANINDLSVRKKIEAGGAKSDIIGIVPLISTWKEVFIIYSNSLHKNSISIDRVNLKKPKPLRLIPGGNTTIISVLPTYIDYPQICFLPSHFSNLNGFLMFENIRDFMENKDSDTITLNRNSPKHKLMNQIYLIK